MPAITIRLAESAVADLEEIKPWYAKQAVPGVGDRLISEIFGRVEALRDHPDIGRIVPEFDQPFLRELIHPPFRIVYRREPKRVRTGRTGATPGTSRFSGPDPFPAGARVLRTQD